MLTERAPQLLSAAECFCIRPLFISFLSSALLLSWVNEVAQQPPMAVATVQKSGRNAQMHSGLVREIYGANSCSRTH